MPIRTDPVLPEEDWQLRLEAPEDGSGVGTLTLAYPEKLNMWSWEATRQLGVLADRRSSPATRSWWTVPTGCAATS
jgi:hypothetical protein